MIELEVSCSMCGKVLHPKMEMPTVFDLTPEGIRTRLEASESEWIVEVNGPNLDTYCSEECAA